MKDGFYKSRVIVLFAFSVGFMIVLFAARPAFCDSPADSLASQRQEVEQYYDMQIEQLRGRADSAVKDVNQLERKKLDQEELVKRNRYEEELGYVPTGDLLSKSQIDEAEKQRTQQEKSIRSKIQYAIDDLEKQKQIALELLVDKFEESLKAPPPPWLNKRKQTLGFVSGIAFLDGNGAAVLDDQIVREKDVVHGVTVVKIAKKYVDFQKDGKTWKQYIGEKPADNW